MSYTQRFGLSRKSPLSNDRLNQLKEKFDAKNEEIRAKYNKKSDTPASDLIQKMNKNIMVADTTGKPNKFYQIPEEYNYSPSSGMNIKGRGSKKDGQSGLDYFQDFLTGAGMTPGYGIFADGANFLLSGGRAIHGALTGGDVKKHVVNMGLAGLGAIPVLGQNVSSGKLAAKYIPKTVKLAQGLDKGSKIMTAGKIAGKIKKAKVGSKYLLSSADSEPYAGYTPKNVTP